MIQPEPKDEPRQKMKIDSYSDIQERKSHEKDKPQYQVISEAVISLVKEAIPNNTSEHEVRLNVAVQSLKHRLGMIGLVRLLELIDQVLYDDTFKKSAQKNKG